MTRVVTRLLAVVCLMAASPASAQPALSIVSAGPAGEIADLRQAAEIRVRFSEPMVPLGRIPDAVAPPFVSIRPAIAGTFRWAGPTILVFTPGSEAEAAARHLLRDPSRRGREGGERPHARSRLLVLVHDADRRAAEHRVVAPGRTLRSCDRDRAAVQPTRAAGRRRRAPGTALPAARMDGPASTAQERLRTGSDGSAPDAPFRWPLVRGRPAIAARDAAGRSAEISVLVK